MRARTTVLVALGIAACLTAPASAATKVKYRNVSADYTAAGGISGEIKGSTFIDGERYGSVEVPTRRGEYALDIRVVDDQGRPVAFAAGQDLNEDGKMDAESGEFCGATPKAWRFKQAGAPVIVFLLAGDCGDETSLPTTGVVNARLHARR